MKVNRLAFVDTETGGLDPDRCALLEVALIVLDDKGVSTEHVWWFDPVGDVDPGALKVNKFYLRKSEDWYKTVHDYEGPEQYDYRDFCKEFVGLTTGAAWIGCIPWFDTGFIERVVAKHSDLKPGWHHRLIDLEAMAFGYLQARGKTLSIPYGSDHLSRLCGVTPPEGDERHTAIGDTRWNKRWFEQMTR